MTLDTSTLDPNIKDVVVTLNSLGYVTTYSCAGSHKEIPKWEKDPRGYISIVGKHRVKTLCKKLGLKRVKVTYWYIGSATIIEFTGLGGPSYAWNLSGAEWNKDWINRKPTGTEIGSSLGVGAMLVSRE